MQLYRYKASFSADAKNAPYKYTILRLWFVVGLFAMFLPAGRAYELFYTAMAYWFVELLVIFLATEHKLFQRMIPWMLILSSLVLLTFYFTESIWAEEVVAKEHEYVPNNKIHLMAGAIWHFVAFIILILTNYFNKALKKRRKERAS